MIGLGRPVAVLPGEDLPPLRRDRRVQALVAASTVSWTGDSVFTIGFAWAAVHAAPPALAGFLVGAVMLPQAAFLLFGGALADRWDTRRILLTCNAVRVLVLLVGVAGWQGGAPRVPLLLGVALLFGVADAIHNPANATLPRQLVRAEDLGRVAGMQQVARRLSVFVGAGVGGWLAAAYGFGAAMLVDAATFVVVGVTLWLVARPRIELPRVTSGSVRQGLVEGFGYVRRDPRARRFVVSLSGLNLFVGPALAVGVSLRVAASGWGATTLGAVEATVGVGAAAGALLAMWWRPGRDALAGFLVLVVQGCGIACLGAPSRVVLVAGAVVVGLTAGCASVLVSGAFQRSIDPAYLGRASSMTSLSDFALMPAMMPLFGWLAATSSVTATALAFGAGMAALSAWGAWGFRDRGAPIGPA
ncbi:MFS transporter [Nocardioides sp. MAHUQ-72]|uniref:MFS transporter n=1 Tax=unclassified Nocardioides TaxID=2615069 RepID=UPI0036104F97